MLKVELCRPQLQHSYIIPRISTRNSDACGMRFYLCVRTLHPGMSAHIHTYRYIYISWYAEVIVILCFHEFRDRSAGRKALPLPSGRP